jgi:hypothetical protein
MRSRLVSTVALAACLTGVLTGCSGEPRSYSCVDWVWFDTPADAAADAEGVVIGDVVNTAGTVDSYGERANVWNVEVSEWIAGEGPSTIQVLSLPRTCEEGSPYPDGDPLDTGDEVMIFVRAGDGDLYETVTGLQGVIPAPEASELPSEWPASGVED